MVYNCYMCRRRFSTIGCLFSHLRQAHAVHYSGTDVHCGQNQCPRIFSSFYALRRHFRKDHSDIVSIDDDDDDMPMMNARSRVKTPARSSNFDMDSSALDSDPISHDLLDTMSQPSVLNDLPHSVVQFVTKLHSQPNVLVTNIESTVRNFQDVLTDVSNFSILTVKNMCEKLNIDCVAPEVVDAIVQLNGIPAILDSVNTEYKRIKYLRNSCYYIEPQEIVLGTRVDSRFDAKLGFTKAVTVQDTMQYIQIEKLLALILSDPVACKLMNEHREHISQRVKECIEDFSDTLSYSNHPFFRKYSDAFIMHLYVDAFETTNELGSHTQVHKLEALYMQLHNFPVKYLSKLNSIFLVGLWYAHDVKMYGYDKLLRPVVEALKQLESDLGMSVYVNGLPTSVHGILCLFSADNLGLHSLFGFLESFRATKFCHMCECKQEEAQTSFTEDSFVMRTRESYNKAVAMSDNVMYNPSVSGIKRGCILNELQYFHVIDNYCVDVMHDILEGILPFELALVLDSLVKEKYFSLDYLNAAIASYDYCSADRNSKPSTFTSLSTIHLNAAEALCFIRNLPLMIASKIPREEPHWQLLLMLLNILDIVLAPVVTDGLCSYLRHLIDEHHTHLKEMYPDKKLLPKHHFLVHYPSCLARCGPPLMYWCMRFEAKHNFFKQVARVIHCFKNICRSLAKRSQLALASTVMTKTLFTSLTTIGPAVATLICSLADSISVALCDDLHLSQADSIYVVTWVKLGHYTLRPKCIILSSTCEGIPQYGVIHHIISVAGILYLVVERFITKYYDEHFHAYALEYSHKPVLSCVGLEGCKDHVPLNCHSIVYEGGKNLFVGVRCVIF